MAVLVEPRLMREEDLPWLKQLCLKRYSHRYHPIETEGWFINNVLKNPLMFYPIRTQNAFLIAMLSILPWLPNELESNIVFLCADEGAGLQALKLLRTSIEWARGRGVTTWKLIGDTEYDLGPLAKRLGATDISPRYQLRLR